MKKEHLSESEQLIKDIECLKCSIALLSQLIHNFPDHIDCERSVHEFSLCVVSRHQLIRIITALKARLKE